jgi:RNA polymerase sigma-70 factor (ECF subfamily)
MDERRRRFEAQVLPHLDAALGFARWLCRSPADAEDIVQDAVLRAFRGFDALRGSDAKAWLLTIVRNCHATALKQQQRRAHVPLPDEEDVRDGPAMISSTADPERDSMRRDAARALERHLSLLPQEHREVLVLREIEELDYRQIAAVTDVPIGTVMSRLARARATLKARLSKERDEGDARAMR